MRSRRLSSARHDFRLLDSCRDRRQGPLLSHRRHRLDARTRDGPDGDRSRLTDLERWPPQRRLGLSAQLRRNGTHVDPGHGARRGTVLHALHHASLRADLPVLVGDVTRHELREAPGPGHGRARARPSSAGPRPGRARLRGLAQPDGGRGGRDASGALRDRGVDDGDGGAASPADGRSTGDRTRLADRERGRAHGPLSDSRDVRGRLPGFLARRDALLRPGL